MNSNEMYAIWWQDDKNYLMCYCVDRRSAGIIKDNMEKWDGLVIVPPGKTLDEVLAEESGTSMRLKNGKVEVLDGEGNVVGKQG